MPGLTNEQWATKFMQLLEEHRELLKEHRKLLTALRNIPSYQAVDGPLFYNEDEEDAKDKPRDPFADMRPDEAQLIHAIVRDLSPV